jgi:hypothetical protein
MWNKRMATVDQGASVHEPTDANQKHELPPDSALVGSREPQHSEAEGALSGQRQTQSVWFGNEFTALRAEFIERFRTENLLVLGALTFLGTILTIAFKDSGQTNSQILLVLPVVMPLIGTFYINQRLSNTTMGIYIRDVLQPRVRDLLGADVLLWEGYVRHNTTILKELTLFIFVLTVFSGSSTFTLVYVRFFGFSAVGNLGHFAWWLGVLLTFVWTALWVFLYRGWFGRRSSAS